ncbi:MAG: hypothetical protein RIR70_662 [Pseudomonadota bacterium]|jgi:endonuclease YncB( thermonuclease family)
MNKPALRLCCLIAFVFALPLTSEASRTKDTRASNASKRAVVLKSARAVPARMARAAKAARPAAKPSRVALVRRSASAPQKAFLPVSAQNAVMSRPVIVGDAAASPSLGEAGVAKKALPMRMYAADGDTFYFNGRKYRVEGVSPALAKQEITKQRLQQLLDSGEVSIEPRAIDDGGLTTAVIRVAGRDVAESFK